MSHVWQSDRSDYQAAPHGANDGNANRLDAGGEAEDKSVEAEHEDGRTTVNKPQNQDKPVSSGMAAMHGHESVGSAAGVEKAEDGTNGASVGRREGSKRHRVSIAEDRTGHEEQGSGGVHEERPQKRKQGQGAVSDKNEAEEEVDHCGRGKPIQVEQRDAMEVSGVAEGRGLVDEREVVESRGVVVEEGDMVLARGVAEGNGAAEEKGVVEEGGAVGERGVEEKTDVSDDRSVGEGKGVSDDRSVVEEGGVSDDRTVVEGGGAVGEGDVTEDRCEVEKTSEVEKSSVVEQTGVVHGNDLTDSGETSMVEDTHVSRVAKRSMDSAADDQQVWTRNHHGALHGGHETAMGSGHGKELQGARVSVKWETQDEGTEWFTGTVVDVQEHEYGRYQGITTFRICYDIDGKSHWSELTGMVRGEVGDDEAEWSLLELSEGRGGEGSSRRTRVRARGHIQRAAGKVECL